MLTFDAVMRDICPGFWVSRVAMEGNALAGEAAKNRNLLFDSSGGRVTRSDNRGNGESTFDFV